MLEKQKEVIMKPIIGGAALLAALTIGLPIPVHAAQDGQSQQQNVTTGKSGTGVKGMPGSKSGPSEKNAYKDEGTSKPAGQDTSNVKGLPGSKSGPTTKPRE